MNAFRNTNKLLRTSFGAGEVGSFGALHSYSKLNFDSKLFDKCNKHTHTYENSNRLNEEITRYSKRARSLLQVVSFKLCSPDCKIRSTCVCVCVSMLACAFLFMFSRAKISFEIAVVDGARLFKVYFNDAKEMAKRIRPPKNQETIYVFKPKCNKRRLQCRTKIAKKKKKLISSYSA